MQILMGVNDLGESTKGQAALLGIIAKAWADDHFKQQLLADPKAILAQEGIAVPAGVNVKVCEDSNELVHLVIPPKPSGELSDELLAQVAGGRLDVNDLIRQLGYNLSSLYTMGFI